jgi:hypothetical protein
MQCDADRINRNLETIRMTSKNCIQYRQMSVRLGRHLRLLGALGALVLLTAGLLGAEPAMQKSSDLESCLSGVGDSILADEYDKAMEGAKTGLAAATKLKDPAMIVRFQAFTQQIPVIKKEYAKIPQLRDALAAAPDDAEKNLAMGKFLCFIKGDWDKGLPYLAKSPDGEIKKTAAKELVKPATTSPSDVALKEGIADAWWAVAGKLTGLSKDNCLLRSALWYDRAIPQIKDARDTRQPVDRLREAKANAWIAAQLPRVVLTMEAPVIPMPMDAFEKGRQWRIVKLNPLNRDQLEDPAKFDYADTLVIGCNGLRSAPAENISAKFQENLRQFVQSHGDVVYFAQSNAEGTAILDNLFKIKVKYGPSPTKGVLVSPQLKEVLDRYKVEDATLKTIELVNYFENVPKAAKVLMLSPKGNLITGAIVGVGKGRLVLTGLTAEPGSVLMARMIFEVLYGQPAPAPAQP